MRDRGARCGSLAEVKSPRAGAGGPGASVGCAAAPVPPGRAVVARVAVVKGRLVRPGGLLHGGRRGRLGLCLGGGRGPVAGVMVVYHPPITHLPPPAVGTSPDAAIHDFKGSCRDAHHRDQGAAEPAGKNPGFSWHISGPL